MSQSCYIPNDIPLQSLRITPSELLRTTLDQLIRDIPPPLKTLSIVHPSHRSGGLYTGYTGIAYLFLHVSARRPHLLIAGHKAIEWARRYLGENDNSAKLEKGCCGIASERLSYDAVKACITENPVDVGSFLAQIAPVVQVRKTRQHGETDPFPSELINGRAGTLYLLRMVKHWVPNSERELDEAMKTIAEDILQTDDDGQGNWHWHGKRYFGAAHGDIGILTQVILSIPSLAPALSEKVIALLDHQDEEGNFPSSVASLERGGKAELVQWCHGATGFIYSLRAIRAYFPDIRGRIDVAISKAQTTVWNKGLLVKQPSLCHGIFGNALALSSRERRNHFLSLATPSSVHQIQEQDPNMFQSASYGKDTSVLMNYLPSAAWTWLVCEDEEPKMIMYTDV